MGFTLIADPAIVRRGKVQRGRGGLRRPIDRRSASSTDDWPQGSGPKWLLRRSGIGISSLRLRRHLQRLRQRWWLRRTAGAARRRILRSRWKSRSWTPRVKRELEIDTTPLAGEPAASGAPGPAPSRSGCKRKPPGAAAGLRPYRAGASSKPSRDNPPAKQVAAGTIDRERSARPAGAAQVARKPSSTSHHPCGSR